MVEPKYTRGIFEIVNDFFKAGADLNHVNNFGETPVFVWAIALFCQPLKPLRPMSFKKACLWAQETHSFRFDQIA